MAPKYRRLSFLSPIFVVTSRHLSEITFLLRHHSVFHFIIRTVTFRCSYISCLFRFNYSHPSWLMKDANRSLAPTACSRFRMHGTSCQSGLQWKFMSWLQFILKTGGHCFYNRNVIYCCNSTLAISYFDCALPLSKMYSRFVNCPLLYFSGQSQLSTIVFFINCFRQLKTLFCPPCPVCPLLLVRVHFKTSFVNKWGPSSQIQLPLLSAATTGLMITLIKILNADSWGGQH